MTDKKIIQLITWKEQTIKDCVAWAQISVKDNARLDDYKAGVAAGWDECLNTLKRQNFLKE